MFRNSQHKGVWITRKMLSKETPVTWIVYKINEILALIDYCMDLKIWGGEQNGLMFYMLHLCTYFWRRGWGHFVRLKICYGGPMLYFNYVPEQLLFSLCLKNQFCKTWFPSFIDCKQLSEINVLCMWFIYRCLFFKVYNIFVN